MRRTVRRRTHDEKAAAREAARADMDAIIKRYQAKEPVSWIAGAYGVTAGWLTRCLEEWGVPRRPQHEVHDQRRPSAHVFRGRAPRRTPVQVRAAKEKFTDARTDVIARYTNGESTSSLAREFQVGHEWIADQLDAWGVPRRSQSAARSGKKGG
ncbi:hypothetical protein ACIO13_01955 [Streptomyces sp. NPDC087425]|uniref:hypothetical protein n=1 Tax=Streptomyces sp. NPDC087425 TaxID=3365787 RepID=UPI0037F3D9FE